MFKRNVTLRLLAALALADKQKYHAVHAHSTQIEICRTSLKYTEPLLGGLTRTLDFGLLSPLVSNVEDTPLAPSIKGVMPFRNTDEFGPVIHLKLRA